MTTSERRFGRGRVDLATLSDAELERELRDRRAKRGVPSNTNEGGAATTQAALRTSRTDLGRHYARLHAKYEPYTKSDDAERRAAAEHLLRGLLRARDELLLALRH
jgi:hypothetical protein